MKHAQIEAERFQQKNGQKGQNIVILVHIMAIFPVFLGYLALKYEYLKIYSTKVDSIKSCWSLKHMFK